MAVHSPYQIDMTLNKYIALISAAHAGEDMIDARITRARANKNTSSNRLTEKS